MKNKLFLVFFMLITPFFSSFSYSTKNVLNNEKSILSLEEYRVTSYYKNFNGRWEKQTIKVRVSNVGYMEKVEVFAYMLYDMWYDVYSTSALKVSVYATDDEKQFTYYAYVAGKQCFFNL